MSKTVLARYYAEEVAKNMLLVYWTEEDVRRDFHLQNAHEAMKDLADALGYDIKKREEES